MTRDELEAIIWRNWPTRGPGAAQAVDAILRAADNYATAETQRARRRRGELTAPPPVQLRTVHYQIPCTQHPGGDCKYTPTSCNSSCWVKRDVLATTVAADVTCRRCQGGTAYLEALGKEIASA